MSTRTVPQTVVIGRDLGPAGRVVRGLAGSLNLAAAASVASLMGTMTPSVVGEVVIALIGAAVAYTAVVGAGGRFLRRVDPWLAAIILVAPLAVLFALPFVPDPVTVGVFLYIAISQFVQAAIGYGGCEIVGIPTLLLRRRYTVYCALNAADVVERWLGGRPRWITWTVAVAAFVLTTLLGVAAQLVGKAVGFFAAYLAFLVVGFVVSKIFVLTSNQPAELGS